MLVNAKLDENLRKIHDAFNQQMRERVEDLFTAYGLKMKETDKDLIDKIRSQLYYEAKKGTVKLGTSDAVRRGLELFISMSASGEEGKKRVFQSRDAMNVNFANALGELDEKGYRGIYWTEDFGTKAIKLGNELFDRQQGGLNPFVKIWNFEGADYHILLRPKDRKWELELRDTNGKLLLNDNFGFEHLDEKGRVSNEFNRKIDAFQKLATIRINRDIGNTHSLYLKFWQKVEGPAKKAFFTAIGRDLEFLDNYEVLRKGNNYFIRRSEEHTSELQSH